MVIKTTLPNYNLSYKTRDLLKDLGNKISQRHISNKDLTVLNESRISTKFFMSIALASSTRKEIGKELIKMHSTD